MAKKVNNNDETNRKRLLNVVVQVAEQREILEDPDISASVEDRAIGGLGIFMTKKLVDDISYEYKNMQNILTIVKKLT